jgi:hypothetical protein
MSWLRHWKTMLGLVVVFAAGVVFGVVGTVNAIKKDYARRMDPATWTPRTVSWISDAGGLTPSQEKAIRPDVAETVADLTKLKTEAEAQRKMILTALFAEILPKLDPPQREKLTQAVKDAAAKAEKDRGQRSEVGGQ